VIVVPAHEQLHDPVQIRDRQCCRRQKSMLPFFC
jgi:hypothetical protein